MLRMYNTSCFSMATMVTLSRLNVTFYVHCLSCLKLHKSVTIHTVLLLLTSGIVSSYSFSGQGYVCIAPCTSEALQWAESVSRDFSELSVNKIHQSGNQAPLSCIGLWHYTRRSLCWISDYTIKDGA